MTAFDLFQNLLAVLLMVGIWLAFRGHWRGQALASAATWVEGQGLHVADWTTAAFEMHRQHPCVTFVALRRDGVHLDVKVRLRMPFTGGWRVDEVACCCPREEGVA